MEQKIIGNFESEISPSSFGFSTDMSSNGEFVITSDEKLSGIYDGDIGSIYIYKLKDNKYELFQRIIGSTDDPIGISVSISNNGIIVSLDNNNKIRIYKLDNENENFELIQNIEDEDINSKYISISDDGNRFIVSNDIFNEIIIFDNSGLFTKTDIINSSNKSFGKNIKLSGNGNIIGVLMSDMDNIFIETYKYGDKFTKFGNNIIISDEINDFDCFDFNINFDGSRIVSSIKNDGEINVNIYEFFLNTWKQLGNTISNFNFKKTEISNNGNRVILTDGLLNILLYDFDGKDWNIVNEIKNIEDFDEVKRVIINGDGTKIGFTSFDNEFEIGSLTLLENEGKEDNKFILGNVKNNEEKIFLDDGLKFVIGDIFQSIGSNKKIIKFTDSCQFLKFN